MTLEFARGANELQDLRAILTKYKIIKGDSNRPNYVRILDDEAFFNVGFGIFLAWIFEKKERDKYCFLKLDRKHTLFLARPSTLPLLNYQDIRYVDNFFEDIPSGNRRHSICPLRHVLLYNIGCLTEVEMNVDFLKCPPENVESCEEHKKRLRQLLVNAILESPEYGTSFGGDPHLIDVCPKIFQFLFGAPLDPRG